MKRTHQPNKHRRKNRHGFLHRMFSLAGRNVIKRRRSKGRAVLAA